MLEAGVHFGHKKRRWNPKMRKYIFGIRQDIHIIDLRKTVVLMESAYRRVRDVASKGGNIIFVCTKKQGRDVVQEQAKRCGTMYVTERWLGGMFTNFETIRSRIEYFKNLERMDEEGKLSQMPRKEAAKLEKELAKLKLVLGGVREMETHPDLLFIVDTVHEEIAVQEARKLGIPIVALVDTNSDPDVVDYPIPGNDDAIRSIKLVSSIIADAVIEGRQGRDFLIAEKEMAVKEEEAPEVEKAALESEKTEDSEDTGTETAAASEDQAPEAETLKPEEPGEEKTEEPEGEKTGTGESEPEKAEGEAMEEPSENAQEPEKAEAPEETPESPEEPSESKEKDEPEERPAASEETGGDETTEEEKDQSEKSE
jgi:small subunit ribosomal protein S2